MQPEQKSFFQEHGYLHLPKALDRSQVRPVQEFLLSELKRLKIWASGKTLSTSLKEMPPFQQIAKLSTLIQRNDLQSRFITKEIQAAITALAPVKMEPGHTQLLISLPHQGPWTLQGLNWHTDVSTAEAHSIPGIQVFLLIDEVKPRGGATLAVAGSHRLRSRDQLGKRIRGLLRDSPDIESELRHHDLSLLEMSGQAGDVYLMDMRLLHTPSINSTKHVRMMATLRYLAA